MSWFSRLFGRGKKPSRPTTPTPPPPRMPEQMPRQWYIDAAHTIDDVCRTELKRLPDSAFYGSFFYHARETGMTKEVIQAAVRSSAEFATVDPSAPVPAMVPWTCTPTTDPQGFWLPYPSEAWYLDVAKTIVALSDEEFKRPPSPTLVGTLLFFAKERGLHAEPLRQILKASQEWQDYQTPPTTAPGGFVPKVNGRLRVENNKRWFANDAGRFDYREFSAFTLYARWLMGQEAHVLDWVRKAKAHKVSVLRIILTLGGDYWDEMPKKWFGHGFPVGPRMPGFYDRLGEFCDAMAAEGLYVRLVLFGDIHEFVPQSRWGDLDARRDATDSGSREKMRQYVRAVADRTKDKENVIYEIANEYGNIGFSNSIDFLVECARLCKQIAPATILNLSAKDGAPSNDTDFIRSPADFVSSHLERWLNFWELNWIKRSGESDVIDQEHTIMKMPYLCGEPTNMGDWRRDGRNSDVSQSLAAAFCYGAVSRTRQYNATFHHDDGLWCAGWGPATDASLDAWRRGLDAIPMLVGDKWRGHWQNDPWRADIYPSTDDENDTKRHVEAGRGPMRIFGTHNYSLTLAAPRGWDHRRGLNPGRTVTEVDRVETGTIECAVYVE